MSASNWNAMCLCSIISRNNRRLSSSGANDAPRESIISSSILNDQPPQPPTNPPPADQVQKNSWSFLKYGLIAALTGGLATASYATYAYSLDEVDQKTKALRASANYTVDDGATSLDKFQAYLRAAAMTVPAKLVDVYLDVRRLAEEQVKGFIEPTSDKLLPDLHPLEQHDFTLVLDLNETLIYSDWKRDRGWRTFKRPGVDAFLEHLAQFYEIVVYSDLLNMDLSKLNRDPAKVIYISGHALESSLQPENCVPIKPWQDVANHRPADIRTVLSSYQGHDIAKEFIERSKEHQKRMQEQKQQGRFWRR